MSLFQGRRQGAKCGWLRGRGQNGKMSRWALSQPWTRHSAGGGGGGVGLGEGGLRTPTHFFFFPNGKFLWQNYYHNGVGVLVSSPYVTELTSNNKKGQTHRGGGRGNCPPDAASALFLSLLSSRDGRRPSTSLSSRASAARPSPSRWMRTTSPPTMSSTATFPRGQPSRSPRRSMKARCPSIGRYPQRLMEKKIQLHSLNAVEWKSTF